MTLSLARDELRYDSQQLDALAQKIRVGDLTPIMEIYEEDIRHPLKSAMMGSLLRGLFIQIQKAKVCCTTTFLPSFSDCTLTRWISIKRFLALIGFSSLRS